MGCTQGGRLSNSFIYPNNENMSLEMLMRIISNSELDKLQSNTYLLVTGKNCYQIIFVLCKYLDKKVFWYTYNIYSVICGQYHTGYVVYTCICCSVVGFFQSWYLRVSQSCYYTTQYEYILRLVKDSCSFCVGYRTTYISYIATFYWNQMINGVVQFSSLVGF